MLLDSGPGNMNRDHIKGMLFIVLLWIGFTLAVEQPRIKKPPKKEPVKVEPSLDVKRFSKYLDLRCYVMRRGEKK
jgi:hypothetical protein